MGVTKEVTLGSCVLMSVQAGGVKAHLNTVYREDCAIGGFANEAVVRSSVDLSLG